MAVVDASVLVAAFLPVDVHHRDALAWLSRAIEQNEPLHVPILALAELGGAIARQTGDGPLANRAVAQFRALEVEIHEVDQALGDKAAELATTLKLRGADATYASLAYALVDVLVTLDDEQLERAQQAVEVRRPSSPPSR